MKKRLFVLMSTMLLLLSLNPFAGAVSAEAKPSEDQHQIDLDAIKNLDALLENLNQSTEDVISSVWLDEEVKSGVINLYNEDEDKYYNLYIEEDAITYYSTQYYVDESKEEALFELYSVKEDNSTVHEFTSSIDKDTGEVEHNIMAKSTDDKVYKWACIFSSRIACIAAAGTLGFGVAGPFGATAATFACGYVFGTLVEKYGSKDAACKLFS